MIYIFFRAEGWYPIQLEDDKDAIANGNSNPGTIKIEDAFGRLIWTGKEITKH